MIARFMAFVLILYVLGFVGFAVALGQPAGDEPAKVDAIVVITGGKGRIEQGAKELAEGKAKRMLIAGVDPSVRKADLIARIGGKRRLFDCCIDLGSESVDTRSNAEEAQRWMKRRKYTSMRLITSDWHMRRAYYEFDLLMGKDYRIVPDAVKTSPGLTTLFSEYNKYLLRRIGRWFDL